MAGRRRSARLGIVVIATIALAVAACGGGPAQPTASGQGVGPNRTTQPGRTPAATRTPRPGSSSTPIEPLDAVFSGALPQSATFAGIVFTVTSASLTNKHPYTMFGTPRPGRDLYGVLIVTAENTRATDVRYPFDDEAFALRTWSGQILPSVHHPGSRPFSNLEPGERVEDEVVFGLPEPEALDGAALLIGGENHTRAVIPLSADPVTPEIPAPVVQASPGPVHVVPIEWVVESGEATFDAPPDAGSRAGIRAEEGSMFVALRLTGTVKGSRYGQATVASDLVELRVDGESLEPLGFDGRANVPEGEAYSFDAIWVTSSDARAFDLVVDGATAIPLIVVP